MYREIIRSYLQLRASPELDKLLFKQRITVDPVAPPTLTERCCYQALTRELKQQAETQVFRGRAGVCGAQSLSAEEGRARLGQGRFRSIMSSAHKDARAAYSRCRVRAR